MEKNQKMHYDENKNGIYDLTEEDKEAIEEHKKFYADFYRFGNKLLDVFPDTIKDYELTMYSMYYRILELLDTLEVMTENSLINSGLIILRSLLEGSAQLCYVLCDDKEMEKRAIVWQMMDIKRTAKDEGILFQVFRTKECYKDYSDIIEKASREWPNWYSYCEGKRLNISDIFEIAGIKDLYDGLYVPLCIEDHEINHMETNIVAQDVRFNFKPFRTFENHALLLNSVMRSLIPVNQSMIDRYGNDDMKNEWKEYKEKAEKWINSNNATSELQKIFSPMTKWF